MTDGNDLTALDRVYCAAAFGFPVTLSAKDAMDVVDELTRRSAGATDAARWRALMRCGRISMQGSAGVDPHTLERRNDSNVHFGAEFWPEPLPQAYRDEHPESAARYDRSTRWGIACLTALADAILQREAAAE